MKVRGSCKTDNEEEEIMMTMKLISCVDLQRHFFNNSIQAISALNNDEQVVQHSTDY